MTANKLLFNASISGGISSISDRWLTAVNTGTPPAIGTADPSYAALAAFGTILADATDPDVPTDTAGSPQPAGSVGISVGGGTAIVPSTSLGGIQQAEIGKTRLLEAIVLGIYDGRYASLPTPTATSLSLAPLATVATDAYLAAVGGLQGGGGTLPAAQNNILWNGCVAGFVGASFSGRDQGSVGSVASAVGEAVALAAVTFAEAFDSLIAPDALITGAAGLAAVPTTGIIQCNQLGRSRLAHSIVIGMLTGRFPNFVSENTETDWLSTTLPTSAAAAVACYDACVTVVGYGTGGLVTASGSPSTGNPWNDILYNAAYCGFIAGILDQRPIAATSAMDPFYVALAAAAAAFAKEVDVTVGAADITATPVPAGTVGISAGAEDGLAIVPSTGILSEAQLGKEGIMWSICRATMKGRTLVNTSGVSGAPDNVAATYSGVAQAIVALYLEMTTQLIAT